MMCGTKRAYSTDSDTTIPFEEITPEPRQEFGFSRPLPASPEKEAATKRSEAAAVLAGLNRSDSNSALDALLGLASAPVDGRNKRLKFTRPPVVAQAVKAPNSPLKLPAQLLSDAKPWQLCLLAAAFKLCSAPTPAQRAAIAERVQLALESVEFWFRTRQVLETWVGNQPTELRADRVRRLHDAHSDEASSDASSVSGHTATADASDVETAERPPSSTPLRSGVESAESSSLLSCSGDIVEGAGAAIAAANASLGKVRGVVQMSPPVPLSA